MWEAKDLQLVIVSRDNNCPIVLPQTQRLNVPHLSLEHEASHHEVHSLEKLPIANAAQHEPIAGVVAPENRGHAEVVSTEKKVGVAVAVEDARQYGGQRRELRFHGEWSKSERAVPVVHRYGRGEIVRFQNARLPKVRGRENVFDATAAEVGIRLIFLAQVRDRGQKLVATSHRIGRAVLVGREDWLGGAIVREIGNI